MMKLQTTLSLAPEAEAPDRKLTTAAAAKKADILSALEDSEVEAIIASASDAVSGYCNQHPVGFAPATLARQSVVETILIPATAYIPTIRKLTLSLEAPEVTAITIDDVAVDIAGVMVSNLGEVSFLPAASRHYWPADQLIKITYDGGYVTPPQAALDTPPSGPFLPADIERAAIIAAQNVYALQSREQFDVAASVEEDSDAGRIETRYFNASRGSGLPGDARALLNSYRRLL